MEETGMSAAEACTILEIPIAAKNDMEQIRKAYRKLAMKWHPDKNSGSEVSAAKFKKITGAYHSLTTVNFDYDRWSQSFEIPPLQTLGDVLELAMKGEDVEGVLRARGEYRPHKEFGINLSIPWSAGEQCTPSWETPSTSYTTTREITGGSEWKEEGSSDRALAFAPKQKLANPTYKADADGFTSMAAGVTSSLLSPDLVVDHRHENAPELAEEANEKGMEAFKLKDWQTAFQKYSEAVRLAPSK
ncbi:hypothetical protein CYMTET_26236, partial [Cymbomonas tetramitiformis]|eukprot:gene6240-7481_t